MNNKDLYDSIFSGEYDEKQEKVEILGYGYPVFPFDSGINDLKVGDKKVVQMFMGNIKVYDFNDI